MSSDLSNKFRPVAFGEMVGNTALFESLEAKINANELSHCILLTGNTGSGKTTTANIIARTLGANKDNVIRINCSNDNGADTARAIVDSMKYPALNRMPKIFLLDEVQKTSPSFQNILLDPLENIPDYVYFVICTTEPDKLLRTFKRRCVVHNIDPVNSDDLSTYLQFVANVESSTHIPRKILRKICQMADNGVGESLSILESIISLAPDTWEGILNGRKASASGVRELSLALLYKKDWKTVSTIIKEQTADMESVRYAILNYMASLLLNNGKDSDRACVIIDYFSDSWQHVGRAGLVNACYQIINLE